MHLSCLPLFHCRILPPDLNTFSSHRRGSDSRFGLAILTIFRMSDSPNPSPTRSSNALMRPRFPVPAVFCNSSFRTSPTRCHAHPPVQHPRTRIPLILRASRAPPYFSTALSLRNADYRAISPVAPTPFYYRICSRVGVPKCGRVKNKIFHRGIDEGGRSPPLST